MSTYRTLLALFGAPCVWVTQMSLSEPLAAYTCYPHQVPLPAPFWVDLPVILAVISLICLGGGSDFRICSVGSWRQTSRLCREREQRHMFRSRWRTDTISGEAGNNVEFCVYRRNFIYRLRCFVILCSAWTYWMKYQEPRSGIR